MRLSGIEERLRGKAIEKVRTRVTPNVVALRLPCFPLDGTSGKAVTPVPSSLDADDCVDHLSFYVLFFYVLFLYFQV
jgi:hypothetical protein